MFVQQVINYCRHYPIFIQQSKQIQNKANFGIKEGKRCFLALYQSFTIGVNLQYINVVFKLP